MLGSFIFRDIIEYILPTIIAIFLFFPFFYPSHEIGLEWLVFSGVVIGYIGSSLVSWASVRTFQIIPYFKNKIKEHKEISEWMSDNWDYARLFYSISNDERDYIYTTSAYMAFYRNMSFFLLVYSIVNFAYLLINISYANISLTEILNIDSPFSGDIRLSSIFVMILSLLFSLVCFDDFLTEYEILFYPEGQHDTFAKRYHKMGNILAKSVWGTIKGRGEIRPGTKISILDSGMKVISSTATDTSGYFQFKNEYIAGLGKTRFFLVVDNSSNQRFEIYLGEDIVPYFEIDLDLHDSN